MAILLNEEAKAPVHISSPDWTLYGETNSGATIIHVNQLYRAGPDVDAFAKHAPCQSQGAEVLTVELC